MQDMVSKKRERLGSGSSHKRLRTLLFPATLCAGFLLGAACSNPRPSLIRTEYTLPPRAMALQCGDLLAIRFFGAPELNSEQVIRHDGNIVLSLIGEIEAAGLTPGELQQVIRDRYQRHLRLMSERLANTEDRTRHRISIHIHDTIIQILSLAAIKIGSLRVDLEEGRLENANHELGTLRTLVTESITESRALMAELSPPLLNELGLVAGLEDLADRLTTLYKVPVEVRNDELDITLDKSIERNLFRCTRELIMNALKHARANAIHVDVWHRDGALVIRVADDGVGFEASGSRAFAPGAEGGFGLFSVVESLKNHHGALTMDSSPGGGVTAEIMIPIEKKRKEAAA